MIRRPPRSTRTDTLLPYTTLFRSAPDSLAALLQAPVDEPGAMRADVTLTVALLRYLDHANNGRIRPSAAGWDVWLHPRSGFVVEAATALRSEDRRAGKAGVSTCRYRWTPLHSKIKTTKREMPNQNSYI